MAAGVKTEISDGCRLHQAILMATKAHSGQKRKGGDLDYICHPMEVMEILTSMGADYNLRIAGALHDTIEDTEITVEEIRKEFGDDVAALVASHSEDKSKTWKERKLHTIEFTRKANEREAMLTMADKISNLRSMAADHREIGEKLWERFNSPKEMQKWYYSGMVEALGTLEFCERTREAYQEMKKLFEEVFGSELV